MFTYRYILRDMDIHGLRYIHTKSCFISCEFLEAMTHLVPRFWFPTSFSSKRMRDWKKNGSFRTGKESRKCKRWFWSKSWSRKIFKNHINNSNEEGMLKVHRNQLKASNGLNQNILSNKINNMSLDHNLN